MSTISTSYLLASTDTVPGTQDKKAAKTNFDALLEAINTQNDAKALSSNLLDAIMGTMGGSNIRMLSGQNSAKNAFPLSSDFTSTFGDSGPLINFINKTTADLHLTAVQNKALQDISVQNKDITKTPGNVEKIAQQLRQAGIA